MLTQRCEEKSTPASGGERETPSLLAESEKKLKSLLMKVKESEKVSLKLSIQKTETMASSLITSWQIHEEAMETVTGLVSWAPKSLQMVTAVMKLKDACSLEEKL